MTDANWPFKLSYILGGTPGAFGPPEAFGRVMRRLRAIGYKGFELSSPYPPDFDPNTLARQAAEAGIRVCSLLSGWSYGNDGLCLCSPDEAVRRRAVARLQDLLGIARRLDAMLIVGLMQGLRSDEPRADVANGRIAEGLTRVCETAEQLGVTVVLEPVNHLQVGFNNTVGEVVEMVRRVASPALRPMVDTVHMNIEERSVTEPIYRVGRDLEHVHLCETNGRMFGTGHLDFAAVLDALADIGYRRFVSVKIYRGSTWEEGAEGAMQFLTWLPGRAPS